MPLGRRRAAGREGREGRREGGNEFPNFNSPKNKFVGLSTRRCRWDGEGLVEEEGREGARGEERRRISM